MISYEGIGEVMITLGLEEEAKPGMVVCMEDSGWARPCEDGELFCGVVIKKDWYDGSVQLKGCVSVTYSGDLDLGRVRLVADGEGGVRMAENGVDAVVLDVPYEGNVAVICL